MKHLPNTAQPESHLVARYLADLDRALSDADPGERADILSSVREHLDDALPGDASADEVAQVLDALGPVEAIARAATPGHTGTADAGWIAVASLGASTLGALLTLPLPFVALALAVLGGVSAVVALRREGARRLIARVSLVIASLTIVALALAAITLVSTATPTEPSSAPIETVGP
ncbi:DUF1700 domain-containing protein [Demequina pelophila]|uniref:DUF1700 domain-containing protein n=1 Tax=Demequina pelophila TaxID=1638984 RepID=UPI00078647C7|nr:hypothetical protein [Demequina pelophila]